MVAVLGATPLVALDAFALDTETTGLDPAKVHVVELAAVALSVGRLDETNVFRSLVRPPGPIPSAATRIHGIGDDAVAGAQPFAEVWPKFQTYLGDEAVLIGHSIGFDLAVLQRECERAGASWKPAVSLDIALLAQIAEPHLPDYSLDALASWLGVEIAGRHSAVGDATASGLIFVGLIPRLRARGIRTLGEAVRASGSFSRLIEERAQAGWAEPIPIPQNGEQARLDPYVYRHRVAAMMSSPPQFVAPDVSLQNALRTMEEARVSSMLVLPSGHAAIPANTGIVTERDVLRALASHGAAALEMPVREMMSAPLATVPAAALSYLAIGRMNRLRIRHLGVTDKNGAVVGVVSARDLLRQTHAGGIELGDEIEQAAGVRELALAWRKLPAVARALSAEHVSGRDAAVVVSQQLRETTRRAVALAKDAMVAGGRGAPPCAYAFVVLGSAGRGESLLAMDQDNALIYAADPSPEAASWFEELGIRVADILHEAGVPYCSGGVMASNAAWRGSVAQWQARVDDWIGRSNPADLLSVDIFFDLDSVHGTPSLAEGLRQFAFARAKGNAGFAKLLAGSVETSSPALGWFGGFRSDNGRVDLKRHGIFPIVSAARSLAVCHGIAERSTPGRLAAIKALGLGMEADLDALEEAHALLFDLILGQQVSDIRQGLPPGNAVEIKRLTRRERDRLRAALRSATLADAVVRHLLFKT